MRIKEIEMYGIYEVKPDMYPFFPRKAKVIEPGCERRGTKKLDGVRVVLMEPVLMFAKGEKEWRENLEVVVPSSAVKPWTAGSQTMLEERMTMKENYDRVQFLLDQHGIEGRGVVLRENGSLVLEADDAIRVLEGVLSVDPVRAGGSLLA
mgnify:CR=1 FL=1